MLAAERPLLNMLGRLSGIASLTRRYVDLLAGTRAAIYDIRKTTPGWRSLEKYAVRCGGGRSHRAGSTRQCSSRTIIWHLAPKFGRTARAGTARECCSQGWHHLRQHRRGTPALAVRPNFGANAK